MYSPGALDDRGDLLNERESNMSPNQNSRLHALLRLAISGLLLWGGAAAAGPAFLTGFEAPDYDGSADGVPVAGQQGWYIPSADFSSDQFIFTYADNALGLPANAFGEDQFLGAQTPDQTGGTLFPRGQLDFDWSAATVWTVSYDFTTAYNGDIFPAMDFICSFSLQDSVTARSFTAVNAWVNPDTATNWDANYIVYDSFGVPADPPGLSPGAAWRNLAVGHWYNESTTFDFDSNAILSVTITDLDTGVATTVEPNGWYLQGGAGGGFPLPTGLRFFVGGGGPGASQAGNVGAFDNLEIDAVAAPSAPNKSDAQGVQPGRGTKGAATN